MRLPSFVASSELSLKNIIVLRSFEYVHKENIFTLINCELLKRVETAAC